jgi:hypothetical protein
VKGGENRRQREVREVVRAVGGERRRKGDAPR